VSDLTSALLAIAILSGLPLTIKVVERDLLVELSMDVTPESSFALVIASANTARSRDCGLTTKSKITVTSDDRAGRGVLAFPFAFATEDKTGLLPQIEEAAPFLLAPPPNVGNASSDVMSSFSLGRLLVEDLVAGDAVALVEVNASAGDGLDAGGEDTTVSAVVADEVRSTEVSSSTTTVAGKSSCTVMALDAVSCFSRKRSAGERPTAAADESDITENNSSESIIKCTSNLSVTINEWDPPVQTGFNQIM
jgi:hypothetical protein